MPTQVPGPNRVRSNHLLSPPDRTNSKVRRVFYAPHLLISTGLSSVRSACYALGALLLVSLLAACGGASSTPELGGASPTALSVAAAAHPTQTPAPSPTATATPRPTATSTPLPTDTFTPPPADTATPQPTPSTEPTLKALLPTPAITPSSELLEELEALEAEAEVLRGLRLTLPITRSLMTRDGLAVYIEQELAEEYSPEEVRAEVQMLAAFDFVPQDFDLLSLLADAYSSEVLGMYDDEADTFYVITDAVGDGLDLVARLTSVHEYTHGLQDEHFELETFMDGEQLNDDQFLARQSLVEGDATLVMSYYLGTHLDEFSRDELEALRNGSAQGRQSGLATAPPIFRETFDFAYVRGLEFVAILQEGGWDAVNAAYADPPQSTEQILHPEKYLARDEPQLVAIPPLTDTLGAGWHLVKADTLGEFQTALYLAQQLDQETVDLASQGWDGDQYALYANNGQHLLAFSTVWDSSQDREEFVTAYQAYAGEKYGRGGTHGAMTELWWETPAQTAVLTWEGTTVRVILGPDRATVLKALSATR